VSADDSMHCPRCGSPEPRKHPATQAEGEVTALCTDAFHGSKQLTLWADKAMYSAAPQPRGDDGRVHPTVRILQATPDPLGTLAAVTAIYKGGVKRSLTEVSDDERREALAENLKTKLSGPLEVISFTILIEGVTRSFTHQMVRGRAAFYAQESLRFAVPDEESWNARVARPAGWESWTQQQRDRWEYSVETSESAYLALVETGLPAEDARGLMPHAMTTRLVWQVSLRELLHVAGLRLCTQAQFEWRTVLSLIVRELRAYVGSAYRAKHNVVEGNSAYDDWQFKAIADLMRPVCYAEGKCGFMSAFDRSCSIRQRVEENAKAGRPSSEWGTRKVRDFSSGNYTDPNGKLPIEAIRPGEWLADPGAAR
jgi:flavin-dependent thymidylate synthase